VIASIFQSLSIRTPLDIMQFLGSLIVFVIGTLILADGVIGWSSNGSFFLDDEPPLARFLVGLLLVMIATFLMPRTESMN
jgi:uncharacterized membrane protein